MSSDKKALISLEKLRLKESFNKRIGQIRKQFKIPPSGFTTTKSGLKWLWDMETWIDNMFVKDDANYQKFKEYEKFRKDLVRDFSIPQSLIPFLNEIIIYSDNVIEELIPSNIFGCSLIEPEHLDNLFDPEEYWKASGKNYATLLIHEGASRNDIRKYIDNNWNKIKTIIGGKGVREKTKTQRDQIVFSLCKLSSKELGIRNGLTRELGIKEMLERKYSIYMSEGNIKRICAEERKNRK